jgi:hypothetical protein
MKEGWQRKKKTVYVIISTIKPMRKDKITATRESCPNSLAVRAEEAIFLEGCVMLYKGPHYLT